MLYTIWWLLVGVAILYVVHHVRIALNGSVMADSDIDWAMQNQLRREWLANNPDSEYPGWLSI